MTYAEKLDSQDSSVTAELWSFDRAHVFRLIIRDYESQEYEWLNADVEFESKNRFYRIKSWEFDTLELAYAVRSIHQMKTDSGIRRTLLRAPYNGDELSLFFKKGHMKRVPQPFLRNRQGNFVSGKFEGFEFAFKVNAIELFSFGRSLKLAASKFRGQTEKGAGLIRNLTR